jgi:hypothetical protein
VTRQTFADAQTVALTARRLAKITRKKWKAGSSTDPARDQDFDTAVRDLDQAVATLKEWQHDGSPYYRDAVRDIGDCLGVKGGTYRDWDKYAAAAASYDEGLSYEVDTQQLGGQPNSYCRVQRLVCRVLAEPEEFVRSGRALDVDLDEELASAIGVVGSQVKIRTDSQWAQADVALLLQLLATRQPMKNAAAVEAWDELDDMGPDRFVYESTLETVKALASRLSPLLDAASRRAWSDLSDRLQHG